jgi:hypothetical protein
MPKVSYLKEMMMRRLLCAVSILVLATPIEAQRGGGYFEVAETGRAYESLQDAMDSVKDRDATILAAPGTYQQCAVQEAGFVTIKAMEPGTVVFDGVTCESKAALVLRGRGAVVDGLVFRNMRVPDGNGSGIRLEKSDLTVVNSMFLNSEQGILTHNDLSSTMKIDRSTFSGLGRCDRGLDCAHSIYSGDYGQVIVTRSRFQRGRGGHYVKLRSGKISITDSSFDDTAGTTTNYMIDLPSGASGLIARNVFVQGRDKENYSAFITVAPEGKVHPSRGLVIVDNKASLAPGVNRQSTFVGNWSREPVQLGANMLGAGIKPSDVR